MHLIILLLAGIFFALLFPKEVRGCLAMIAFLFVFLCVVVFLASIGSPPETQTISQTEKSR